MQAPRKATSHAVAWASVEILFRQGLPLASTVVLARLLTPADFGVVAMLSLFVALALRLVDGGFATALIQQKGEDDIDSSTAFWFNIAAGTVMALALAACAPLIGRFYGHQELVPITQAMALNIWLASWLTVHGALLVRQMRFRILALCAGIANLAGAATAIALAVAGAGVWALVTQALVTTGTNAVMVWRLHAWRPVARFDPARFRKLFRFGGFMLASAILDTLATRFYSILIGRIHSRQILGLYSQAIGTRDTLQTLLMSVFSRVSLPVLSRHGSDPIALRRRLRAANQITMAINLPAMVGLAIVANIAMPTLFGRQWTEAGPILQVLCVAGALYPMQVANVQVLMAQGHSDKMFQAGAIKSLVLLSSTIIASHWGVMGIAWAAVASAIFSFLLNTYYSHVLIRYGAVAQLRDIAPCSVLALAMGALVWGVDGALIGFSPGKRLAIEVSAGVALYCAGALAFRLPPVAFLVGVLSAMRHNGPAPCGHPPSIDPQ